MKLEIPVDILLIEDTDSDARRIESLLRYVGTIVPKVLRVRTLHEGMLAMSQDYDCILLDLGLPDTDGFKGIIDLLTIQQDVAIVVLTGSSDFVVGVQSIQAGAQEFVYKDDLSADMLERAIVHAIERRRRQSKIQSYYRETLHAGLQGTAGLAELEQQNRDLKKTVQDLRELIREQAAYLLVDADVRISLPTTTSVAPAAPVASKQRNSVMDVVAAPVATHDPRAIIAGILEKYAHTG